MSAARVTLPLRICCVCGADLTGRRRDAKTCEGACRVALHRIRRAEGEDGQDALFKRREFVRRHLQRSLDRQARLLMERDKRIERERAA